MVHVDRRDFIVQATGGIAIASALKPDPVLGQVTPPQSLNLDPFPNFCAHEHWGSIHSIGMSSEGFRADTEAGAVPRRRTGIWDLVLDPYLGGWIAATGFDAPAAAKEAGAADVEAWWHDDPDSAFKGLLPHLQRQQTTGVFQCIRLGVQMLHGHDPGTFELDDWRKADEAIASRYKDLFAWYKAAMAKASFSELIRPVHPIFYFREDAQGDPDSEKEFTHTILRIDPLLKFWTSESRDRDTLAEKVGVDPADATSWREFIGRLFNIGQERGTTGIKQLQAYSRPLRFDPHPDTEVKWRGELSDDQVKTFQDWVVQECCKQAHERGWPHQVHVGTHNLRESSPLPLESLAKRFPRMKVVMIHCWPFIEEAGWLAKHVSNIYIDTCWQPVLNPRFLQESLTSWLNYVPTHKIMCSHDSTSIEMAVGSSILTRQILAETLETCCARCVHQLSSLGEIAVSLLQNNSVNVYGIGTEWSS